MSVQDDYKITLNNEKIWSFYNKNKNINIEAANLLLINFMESIFNQMTHDVSTNVNAQLLSFISENLSFISENRSQIDTIRSSLDTINNNVSKLNTDIANNMLIQFMTLKKDYIEDVRQIITNNALSTNEKMSSLMDKNNNHLIDKTSLILNEVIPKNQEQFNKQIQDNFKQFHTIISDETNTLAKSLNHEKSLQDFISNFETKYSSMMQSIQQPILSVMSSSEERINNNIDKLKETSSASNTSQSKIFEGLEEFLGKWKNSSNKGKFGENNLCSILNSIYPIAEITDTTGTKASGDFMMKRLDKPIIMFETKAYDYNMTKEEVSKFIRDIDTQNVSGIFMSQHSGIAFKQNFQIDIHKGNVLIYIQHCEYSADKITIAVDIIDHLTGRIQELNIDETNNISKDTLDDINLEYQTFITQKDGLMMTLKDFQKRLTVQIDDLKMPTLDKYLAPKYANVKTRVHMCDICNVFTSENKQSVSAHKRGCAKKMKAKEEGLTNTVVSSSN